MREAFNVAFSSPDLSFVPSILSELNLILIAHLEENALHTVFSLLFVHESALLDIWSLGSASAVGTQTPALKLIKYSIIQIASITRIWTMPPSLFAARVPRVTRQTPEKRREEKRLLLF